MVVPGGAYFAALSSRLNSTCSNSTASISSIGRSAARLDLDPVARRGSCSRARSALPTISPRSCSGAVRHDRAGLEPGHVEQVGDEAVEPLRLVDDRREQVGLLRLGERVGRDRAASRPRRSTAASGVLRSCEIEVSSAERSRSVSIVRLTRSMSSTRWTRSIASALWSIKRIEQPALVRAQQRARLVAVDADHADRAAPGAHRQEQPLGARQRVGAAPGGAIVLPGPFGRREVGFVERVLRRIAGLDGDRAVLRQQQHDAHLQHQGDLIGASPTAHRRACRRRRACG